MIRCVLKCKKCCKETQEGRHKIYQKGVIFQIVVREFCGPRPSIISIV